MSFINLSANVGLPSAIQVDLATIGRIVVSSNIQAVTGSFSGNLIVTGSHSVAGVSQFSAASFVGAINAANATFTGRVLQLLPSTNLGSTSLISNQVAVAHATTGSVLTFTWKGSDGNMFRANISGASA